MLVDIDKLLIAKRGEILSIAAKYGAHNVRILDQWREVKRDQKAILTFLLNLNLTVALWIMLD